MEVATSAADRIDAASEQHIQDEARKYGLDPAAWPFVASGFETTITRGNRHLVAAYRLTNAHAAKLIRERREAQA